jgi:hypothetical protein
MKCAVILFLAPGLRRRAVLTGVFIDGAMKSAEYRHALTLFQQSHAAGIPSNNTQGADMLTMLFSTLALTAAEPVPGALLEHALRIDVGESTYVVHLQEDGTFTVADDMAGGWVLVNETLCITANSGESTCQPVADDVSLGDTWEGDSVEGVPVTLTIVERS